MNPEQQAIRTLSDRLVNAQIPIRILDAIKWTDDIKQQFFAHKCEQLPNVDTAYYTNQPLLFDPDEKCEEFQNIIRDTRNQLGQYSIITRLIEQRCLDYIKAVNMLAARGTPRFSQISKELYGGPDDAFYIGGPKLSELGILLGDILQNLSTEIRTQADEKKYSADEALQILQTRLKEYFNQEDKVIVKLSDNIVADAAAGADSIKLNRQVYFSERDLRYLEVHEGWVHVGTTLNGLKQPYCTFLAKGSPASTVTQEGLAVITEVFTFSAYPDRLLKLTNRVRAIDMVNQGANFIDAYRFLKAQGYPEEDAYTYSMRVFRGSNPTSGPFTKDLSYTKGFVLLYNYIRLAVQKGVIQNIPMFFVGKTLIEEAQVLAELAKQGLVNLPVYLPPQFKDLAALSAWMSFSLFLNKFDLETLAKQYRFM